MPNLTSSIVSSLAKELRNDGLPVGVNLRLQDVCYDDETIGVVYRLEVVIAIQEDEESDPKQ